MLIAADLDADDLDDDTASPGATVRTTKIRAIAAETQSTAWTTSPRSRTAVKRRDVEAITDSKASSTTRGAARRAASPRRDSCASPSSAALAGSTSRGRRPGRRRRTARPDPRHAAAAPAAHHRGHRGRPGLRRGRRADLRVPGLLLEPRRGRRRAADPGAADPDQPAHGRRHRDQRLPGRRSRAAGPARGVRPGDARREHPDRRGGRGAAGRHRGACRRSTSSWSSYAATIEQARANNRQGLPIGAQYLRDRQCRAPGRPRCRSWTTSCRRNADRAADEMDVRIGYLARRRRAARPGRGGPDPGLGGPALQPPDQCRPAAQLGRPAAHRGDRADRGGAAEQHR